MIFNEVSLSLFFLNVSSCRTSFNFLGCEEEDAGTSAFHECLSSISSPNCCFPFFCFCFLVDMILGGPDGLPVSQENQNLLVVF